MSRFAAAVVIAYVVTLPFFPSPFLHSMAFDVTTDLPLVDFHQHLLGRMSADDLILLMDESGISRMVLMPNGQPKGGPATDEQARMYAEQFPGRFIPFLSLMVPVIQGQRGQRERWLHPDGPTVDFLRQIENKLKTGKFYGMGELVARHYGYTNPDGGRVPEFDNPVDSALVHKLAELAERYHVPIVVHAEGEPAVVAAIGRVLEAHPGATIIWAHNCGRSSVSKIREFLQRYANLLCDLGGMAGTFGYVAGRGPRSEPWTALIEDGQGHLLPDMKEAFEAFPDRFVGIGMDAPHYANWRGYKRHVVRFRQLFSQLSAATAKQIAHENAERLFHLPPLRP